MARKNKPSYLKTVKDEFKGTGIKARTKQSRKWFMDNIYKVRVKRRDILDDGTLKQKRGSPLGNLYMYFYDPKHRKDLPYYDAFPLVMVVEPAKGGFYGLNFHYLHPATRAVLLDKLITISGKKNLTQRTKLALTYELLRDTAKLKEYKPCFKRYLTSQIEGRMMKVPPEHWETVLFLPTEQFRKKSKSQVWSLSKKKYK